MDYVDRRDGHLCTRYVKESVAPLLVIPVMVHITCAANNKTQQSTTTTREEEEEVSVQQVPSRRVSLSAALYLYL